MNDILEIVVFFPLFLLTVTAHEFSHGYVAYKLGDDTAKKAGRLTLNPIAHMSIYMTVIFPAILLVATWFRFTMPLLKPVPINPLYFKNPKRGLMWVGIAGPASNLLIVLFLSFFMRINLSNYGIEGSIKNIISLLIVVNLLLAMFNLLPVPPLDGSRVLVGLLPNRQARALLKIDKWGLIILVSIFAGLAISLPQGLAGVVIYPLRFAWRLFGLDAMDFQRLFYNF